MKSWLLEVFSHFFLGCFYDEISFILFIRFPFLGILGEVIILTEELESKEKKACRVLGLSYDELCKFFKNNHFRLKRNSSWGKKHNFRKSPSQAGRTVTNECPL